MIYSNQPLFVLLYMKYKIQNKDHNQNKNLNEDQDFVINSGAFLNPQNENQGLVGHLGSLNSGHYEPFGGSNYGHNMGSQIMSELSPRYSAREFHS